MGDAAAPLFLGVDGGGTGCRARLEDADGTVLGAGIAGPATTRLGIEQAMAAVETACLAALAEAGLSFDTAGHVHCGIGLAGMGRKGAREALEARPHPFASIAFATDGLVACIGAHSGLDGGIVIVGTGTCGLRPCRPGGAARRRLRVSDLRRRIGRRPWAAGNPPRAAGAGRPHRPVRAADRRAGAVRRRSFEAVAWMDRASATDYATFAPLVMRHADNGDPVGRRIVQGAAEQVDGS